MRRRPSKLSLNFRLVLPSMGLVLPDEVLQRIVDELQAVAPTQVARLALVLPTQVRRALHTRHLLASSSGVKQFLLKLGRQDKELAGQARSLTIRRGTRSVPSTARVKGRKAKGTPAEDAVTPEDLVQLAQHLTDLVELRLLEPAFDSLRRRQVDFASRLPHLRSLSIVGRTSLAGGGFNLHTVGQVLQATPNLCELALRDLNCCAGALAGLAKPACKLSSFALFGAPSVTSEQLYWLLHASIYADSLRSLAFDVSPGVPPSHFAPVKWAATPVTRLAITSSRAEVAQGIPQHFPSLRHFAFRSSNPVNPHRLLASCAACGSVQTIEDRSPAEEDEEARGVATLAWAEALLLARRRLPGVASLRRLALVSARRAEAGWEVLEEVCRLLGVQLETYELEREAASRP